MSSAFEGVFNGGNAVFQMKMFNYYHELTDSNYIDIDDEWWYKDAITELSVDPYGYRFLFGEINIDNISRASCIYYNKDLYEQYVSVNKDKDELYQTVLDGKWTFDEFARLVKKSHISKGGDGSNDIYGFHLDNDEYNHYFRESAGIRLYSRDDYGMPVLSVDVEKAADFATAIYELYFENEGTFNTKYDNRETDATFTNNQFVFSTNKLLLSMDSSMREMKSDFGILPFPKYDEEQEEYISLIHNSSTLVAIPVSTDIDRANEEISAVIEALASESYRSVTVSFYEMALKAAYNRDDQSAQMIDIITGQHDTVKSVITKNFAYEYNSSLSSFGYIYNTLLSKRSNGFASTYDSILPSAKTALTDLIKKYKDGTI
jgi:ABC-type glycerol-3-phosphate transport system substrate-binding protein